MNSNRLTLGTDPARKTTRLIILIILGVVLLLFLVQTYHKAYRDQGNDFTGYRLAAKAVLSGENPYQQDTPFPFLYPIFAAMALIPLAIIPYNIAIAFWFFINAASLVYCVKLIAELFDEAEAPALIYFMIPAGVILIMLFEVLQNNFLNGQINFVILMLCLLFLKYERLGCSFRPSIFLALAISLKLLPAIFFIYLVVRLRIKLLAIFIVLIAFLNALPYVFYGSELWHLYSFYIDNILINGIYPTSSQTIVYFTPLAVIPIYVFDFTSGLKHFAYLGGVVLILAIFDIWNRVKHKGKSLGVIGLYFIAMLLINPMSEVHHLIILLPPLLIIGWNLYNKGFGNQKLQTIFFAIFWILYFAGNFDKYGPYYFAAIISLIIISIRYTLSRKVFDA